MLTEPTKTIIMTLCYRMAYACLPVHKGDERQRERAVTVCVLHFSIGRGARILGTLVERVCVCDMCLNDATTET